MFMGASVPVLAPSNVQEVLDFGIYGWAMSRFSGCWVASEGDHRQYGCCDGCGNRPCEILHRLPPKEAISPDGMHARWPDPPSIKKTPEPLQNLCRKTVCEHQWAQPLVMDSVKPTLGIITSGKAYLDVMEALGSLGIDDQTANDLGIRVLKIGMPWPLDPEIIQVFSRGLTGNPGG